MQYHRFQPAYLFIYAVAQVVQPALPLDAGHRHGRAFPRRRQSKTNYIILPRRGNSIIPKDVLGYQQCSCCSREPLPKNRSFSHPFSNNRSFFKSERQRRVIYQPRATNQPQALKGRDNHVQSRNTQIATGAPRYTITLPTNKTVYVTILLHYTIIVAFSLRNAQFQHFSTIIAVAMSCE
jgi:hypothetical protein